MVKKELKTSLSEERLNNGRYIVSVLLSTISCIGSTEIFTRVC
jgi:hypothetical protein